METKKQVELKFISNLKLAERKKLRERTAKLIENMKSQNALLTELYLLPNKHALEKAELMLKGRVSVNEFLNTMELTRKRYAEIINKKVYPK